MFFQGYIYIKISWGEQIVRTTTKYMDTYSGVSGKQAIEKSN